MHCLFITNRRGDGGVPACKLNPAQLTCTCKGYRMRNICAHCVACTACYITDAQCAAGYELYDYNYLTMLVEKLVTTKPAAHRPRRTVGAQRIQPHGDSSEDDEEDEEEADSDDELDDT